MLSYPNLKPEWGDTLIAFRDESWGHVADHCDDIEPDDYSIEIEMGDRLPQPHGDDTFDATVNGNETTIHIDLLTDIFQLADSLVYKR